jgi:hypothetical protein
MGIMFKLREGDPRLLEDPEVKRIHQVMGNANHDQAAAEVMREFLMKMSRGEAMMPNPAVSMDVWKDAIALADQYNDPGNFTALIGFEWTSMPDANNLHRVVVYADGADKAGSLQPLSSNDGEDPANLWSFMEQYEKSTGGRILAIPHNGNLSNGLMFRTTTYDGEAMDGQYAQRRLRWEPLVEVTQIKGDGEAHPFLSPDDEFADFETWDGGNFAAIAEPNKRADMLQYEYARSALKLGLAVQAETGANPYRFGMIGSTDSHTSLATAAEDNFWGKASMVEPGTDRASGDPAGPFGPSHPDTELTKGWTFGASGYAAVWARENTRDAIFGAMQRREVYATSGSRISLRFFGGWAFDAADVQKPHAARIGYRKGVPMGGELGSAEAQAPGFMIIAMKDPHGANLDRVQIVKGWRDASGALHEKVYNVAVSDNRAIARDGRVEPLTNTVDLDGATYRNEIGEAQFSTYWQDPQFDPAETAFYYARVIEIPTPRWTAYDAARLGKTVNAAAPKIIQDRAYSSPIWYNPE